MSEFVFEPFTAYFEEYDGQEKPAKRVFVRVYAAHDNDALCAWIHDDPNGSNYYDGRQQGRVRGQLTRLPIYSLVRMDE